MSGVWKMKACVPEQTITIKITVQHPEHGNYFTASLCANRVECSQTSIERFFWFMPHKTALGIYWQVRVLFRTLYVDLESTIFLEALNACCSGTFIVVERSEFSSASEICGWWCIQRTCYWERPRNFIKRAARKTCQGIWHHYAMLSYAKKIQFEIHPIIHVVWGAMALDMIFSQN